MKSFTLTVVGILFMTFVIAKADINIEVAKKIKETFDIHPHTVAKIKQTFAIITACTDKITLDNFIVMIQNPDAESTNEKIKCLKACILSQSGFMKEKKLQMEQIEGKVNALLGDEKKELANSISDAIKTCIEEANQSENECDVAASFETCMKKLAISKM